jgi:hypothetical protein
MLREPKLPKCFGRHRCWTYRQKRCDVEFACRYERDVRIKTGNPLPRYTQTNANQQTKVTK